MPDTTETGGDADDNHTDACVCDIAISDSDITLDSDLPAAQGGVEAAAAQHDTGDDIDGCDVEFSKADATADEELPIAVGGVG